MFQDLLWPFPQSLLQSLSAPLSIVGRKEQAHSLLWASKLPSLHQSDHQPMVPHLSWRKSGRHPGAWGTISSPSWWHMGSCYFQEAFLGNREKFTVSSLAQGIGISFVIVAFWRVLECLLHDSALLEKG